MLQDSRVRSCLAVFVVRDVFFPKLPRGKKKKHLEFFLFNVTHKVTADKKKNPVA